MARANCRRCLAACAGGLRASYFILGTLTSSLRILESLYQYHVLSSFLASLASVDSSPRMGFTHPDPVPVPVPVPLPLTT